MVDHSTWLDQLVANLDRCGPEGEAAARYLREQRVQISLHEQPTAARWTLGRQIQLHPRYAAGEADQPYPLTLIIHEVRHLQQGFFTALSVYGELEAWQLQFTVLKSLTGAYHADFHRNALLGELMSLPLNWDRASLLRARHLMQAYAGRQYRVDLLPFYPLPTEIRFRLTGREPAADLDNRIQK